MNPPPMVTGINRTITLILLFIILITTSPATGEGILTIEQSIDRAKQNNLRFRQEKNKLIINILQEKKSRAEFYPRISTDLMVTGKAEPIGNFNDFDAFNPYVLELRIPIYYFGELKNKLEASKARKEAGAYNLVEKELLLERAVFQAFMNVLHSQKKLLIQQEAAEQAQKILKKVEKMVQEGKKESDTILRWKVLLDEYEDEETKQRQKLHDSFIAFNRLLERETETTVNLAPYGSEEFETDLAEHEEINNSYSQTQINKFLFAYALNFNPIVKKNNEIVSEAKHFLEAEKTANYPKLDLVNEYRSKDAKSPFFFMGLRVRCVVFDARNSYDVAIKEKTLENLQLDYEIFLNDINSRINSSYSKMKTSMKQALIRLKQTEESRRFLDNITANYFEGKASDLDLTDAFKKYFLSRYSEIDALYEYYNERQNLYTLLGYSYYRQTTTLGQFIKSGGDVDVAIRDIAREVIGEGDEIIEAVNRDNIEKVRQLVEANPSLIQKKNYDNWTHLHLAAYNGNAQIIRILLDNKAEIDSQTRFGRTPLYLAASQGKTEAVKILVEKGANVNTASGRTRWTPLMRASKKGYPEIITILLEAGANPNEQSQAGWTALHNAAEEGYVEIVKTLLEKGADPTLKTSLGKTPLNLAEIEGHNKVIKLLNEHETKRTDRKKFPSDKPDETTPPTKTKHFIKKTG